MCVILPGFAIPSTALDSARRADTPYFRMAKDRPTATPSSENQPIQADSDAKRGPGRPPGRTEITRNQAAKRLGRSVRQLRTLCQEGKIRSRKIIKHGVEVWVVDAGDVERHLREHGLGRNNKSPGEIAAMAFDLFAEFEREGVPDEVRIREAVSRLKTDPARIRALWREYQTGLDAGEAERRNAEMDRQIQAEDRTRLRLEALLLRKRKAGIDG